MDGDEHDPRIFEAATERVGEAQPQMNLRPSLENLADVAARRSAGDAAVLVTLLSCDSTSPLGLDPDRVEALPGIVVSAPDEGIAYLEAHDAAGVALARLPASGRVSMWAVLHQPAGTWVVFPLLRSGFGG
jgi:hypothetical protein